MPTTILTKCCKKNVKYQQDATNYYTRTKFQDIPAGELTETLSEYVDDYGFIHDSYSADGGDFVCTGCGLFVNNNDCVAV